MTAKLSVELVPQSQFYSNLRDVLNDNEWNQCKQLVYKQSNRRCEICGGVGPKHPVECHEIWNYCYPDVDVCNNTAKIKYMLTNHPKHIYRDKWLAKLLGVVGNEDLPVEQQMGLVKQRLSASETRATLVHCLLNANRKINGVQQLTGLIALCPDCHLSKHYGFAQISGKEHVARRQLKKVNSWDDERLDNYLALVHRQWEARNKTNWTLDVSWIVSRIQLSTKTEKKLNLSD